jgi:hypothetical protein
LHGLSEELSHPFQFVQQPGVFVQRIWRRPVSEVPVFQRHGTPAHIAPVFDLDFEIPREALGEGASQIRRLAERSCKSIRSHRTNYEPRNDYWQDFRWAFQIGSGTYRLPNRSSNFP